MNPWHLPLTGVAAAVSSGVLEERLFRGVVFRIVEEAPGSWISLVGPSLLFRIEASVTALLLCTGAGVVLLIMTVRRGNIIPPFWRRTH